MTAPGVNSHGVEPGIGEFDHGRGIQPARSMGYVPDNRDELMAIRQTDPANPTASHEAMYDANPSQGSVDNLGVVTPGDLLPHSTPRVREGGPAPSGGQHKRIDPSLPRGGDPEHYADGLQDGAGEAWRESLPPNPVTDPGPNDPEVSGP